MPRWFTQVLKLAISLGLLWLLFSRVDVSRLAAAARQSSRGWVSVALLSYTIAVLASSWRWHRLLRIQQVDISLRAVTESSVVALFFNNFLPTNIGGDVMRIRDTARAAGSGARAATVVVADRILGLLALVFFAAVGGAVSASGRVPFSVTWIWLLFAGGVVVFAAVLLLPRQVSDRIVALTRVIGHWAHGQMDALTHSLAVFRSDPLGLVTSFAASLVVQGAFIGVYIAVARALAVPIRPWDMAIIVPLAGLLQIAPVSINGFGVREAAFTVFFTRLGLPREAALLVSLESTALIMGFSIFGAVLYVARHAPEKAPRSAEPALTS